MTQVSLFDAPAGRARATDPVTSVAAARSQRGGAEQAILALFTDGRTFTPDEASWCLSALGIADDTARSAFSRLCRRGVLVATGETRLTRRGCAAQVWRLA